MEDPVPCVIDSNDFLLPCSMLQDDLFSYMQGFLSEDLAFGCYSLSCWSVVACLVLFAWLSSNWTLG
jgi:hypothetical protein